jgi:hypothetical protein
LLKKRPNIFGSFIYDFFASKEPFKKDDVELQKLLVNMPLVMKKFIRALNIFPSKFA